MPYSLDPHSGYSSLCLRILRYCKLVPYLLDKILQMQCFLADNRNRGYEQLPVYTGGVQWEV